MSARTERRRGFTLLELMVAASVGIVIITAAMAAFDLQSQFARNTERLLGTQATAGLGLTMMQRDLENAGLRFRGGVQTNPVGPAYAVVVRPYDNLANTATLWNDPAGSTSIPAVSGPTGGFIPGTDAFEVLQGGTQANTTRIRAQVQTVNTPGPLNQRFIRINPDPFDPSELAAGGSQAPVLMFWNDDVHCMGRVVGAITPGSPASATVQTVNLELALSGTAFNGNCPAPLMQVEVLEQRHRYLIYQSDDNVTPLVRKPARIGLHMQTNLPCNPLVNHVPCSTDLQPPTMVAEGVDDMQIAWRVIDSFTPSATGWCQANTTDPSCGFELGYGSWTATIEQRAAAIFGAKIMLSSRGQEIYRRPGEPVPVMLNHVPAPAVDGIVRSIMQTSVSFRNSVTP
jgi:prepilin-type N-terminal cleavage/methylation domain-containing protein